MVLINPNTTWNRGGFPYLRDKQHSDKHFLSIQNTIDGVTSKSKHRRSLSYLLSSPVCVYVFDLLTFRFSIVSLTLAHLLPECVSACFCLCASVCLCVRVSVCRLATAVLLPSLSGRCMFHTLFHLPAPLSVT